MMKRIFTLSLILTQIGAASGASARITPLLASWQALEMRIQQGLGVSLPSRAQDLRMKTAETLLNDPGLPLETAIAASYGEINGLEPGKTAEIGELIKAGSALKATSEFIELTGKDSYTFDGKIHIAPNHVFDGLGVRALSPDETIDTRHLPVASWFQSKFLDAGALSYQTMAGGKRYLATSGGLYRQQQGRWREIGSAGELGLVKHLAWVHGKVFVATSRGVFVRRLLGWKQVWGGPEMPSPCLYVGQRGDKVIIGTETALLWKSDSLSRSGPHWGFLTVPHFPLPPKRKFKDIREIDGEIFALSDRLLRLDGKRWVEVPTGLSPIKGMFEMNAKLYLARDRSLWELDPKRPQSALAEVSGDVGGAIEEARQAAKARAQETPAPPHAPGNKNGMIDGKGRVIFSDLAAKVKSLLGSARLNFIEPEKTAPPLPGDHWTEMDRWLDGQFGGAIRQQEQGADLRKETAAILRNEPNLDPARVLAKAYAKVHGLSPEKVAVALNALEDKPSLDLSYRSAAPNYRMTEYRELFSLDGKLYSLARLTYADKARPDHPIGEDILLINEDGGWKRVEAPEIETVRDLGGKDHQVSPQGVFLALHSWLIGSKLGFVRKVNFETEIAGVRYLAAADGLYARTGKTWTRTLSDVGAVNHVALIDGRLYAAADDGLFIWKWRGWTKVLDTHDNVAEIKASLFVAKENTGLINVMDDGYKLLADYDWEFSPSQPGAVLTRTWFPQYKMHKNLPTPTLSIYQVLEDGESQFASTNLGIYLKKSGHWEKVAPGFEVNSASRMAVFNGRLYVKQVRDGVWSMPLIGPKEGWRDALMGDAAKDIEEAQKIQDDASSTPASLEGNEQGIVGSHGRRIFSP